MFSPLEVDEKGEMYHVLILTLEPAYFGPLPDKYVELADALTMEDHHGIERLVTLRGGRRIHRNTAAYHLSKETVDFLDRLMKLDMRDRLSARDLLQDQWLLGVAD